jgi:hypothetical protein
VIQALAHLPAKPTPTQIQALAAELRKLPQVDAPITHHFADGVYGREMFLPAGATIVGKMHRFATLNILAQGEISVTNADGAVRVLKAPAVFVSPPMCQKVGHAITDVVWINVHATRITDLASIEAKFIVPETTALPSEPVERIEP